MWPFANKNKTPVYHEDLANCNTCGCLLVKNRWTEGKPEIVEGSQLVSLWTYERKKVYYTQERFYCKAHHPDNQQEEIPF